MIVEVVGTPGAGKSTTARGVEASPAFAGRLRFATLRLDDDGRWSERAAAVLGRPALAAALGRGVRLSSLRADLAAVGRLARRDRMVAALPADSILDSGVVFGAAVAVRRLDLDAADVVGHLRLPDVVVDLRVDPAVAAARVRSRADGHAVATMADDEATAYMRGYRDALDQVLDAVALPVLRIEASALPAEAVVAEVVARLTAWNRARS